MSTSIELKKAETDDMPMDRMHKQFAAMQLKLKERVEKEDKEREEAARAPPK